MEKSIENALAFEGYTSDLSLAVMKAICSKLKNETLTTLEIGYFKGRTTEIVLENGSTTHIIIDCVANLNEKHSSSDKRIILYKSASRYIEPSIISFFNQVDYLFIDGGHEKGDLWNDLELANHLLKEDGILVVDDIDFSGMPGYPHLIKTLDDYCDIIGSFVKICLVDCKQMILCRPSAFIKYYNYLFFDVPKMVYVDIERPIAIRPFNKYLFKINNGWEKEYPVKYQPYGDDDNFYLPTKINSSILNNDFNKTLLKDIFSTQ